MLSLKFHLAKTLLILTVLSYTKPALALSVEPADLGEFEFDKDIVCYIDPNSHNERFWGGVVRKNNKVGLANKEGSLIIPAIYQDGDCMIARSSAYVSFKQNKHWGLVDFHHNIILDFKYDRPISSFNGVDSFVVARQKTSVDLSQLEVDAYNNEENFQYAVVNKKGDKLIDWQDKPLSFLTADLLLREYSQIIDLQGNPILTSNHHYISYINKDRFLAYDGQYYFVIDINNQKLSEYYQEIHPYNSQGYARVFQSLDDGTKMGFIDTTGNLVIAMNTYSYPAWHDVFHYQYELDTSRGCRIYLVDKEGGEVNDPKYPDIDCQSLFIKPAIGIEQVSWLGKIKQWFLALWQG